MKVNGILQWCGTVCFIVMYTVMSFYPTLHPWNIVAGLCGSVCYFIWCVRVTNWPQMMVNAVSITLCLVGLFAA